MRRLAHVVVALGLLPAGGCADHPLRPLGENLHIIKPQHSTAREAAAAECQRGLALLEVDRLPAAEEAFLKAISLAPEYGPAHNNLGRVHFCRREFYLAAREFRTAQELLPRNPEPHNNLGLVYETTDQLDEAAECYARAWSLAPEHPEVIGNYARILVRRVEQPDLVRRLLHDLLLHDVRPDWIAWARELLVTLGPAPPTEFDVETLPLPPQPAPMF